MAGEVKPTSHADDPNIQYGVKVLQNLGLTEYQIAGALGSIQQESGFKPNAYNPDDPDGGSVGMGQWNGPRLEALQEWSERNGFDMFDPKVQWDWFAEELSTTEAEALARVKETKSTGEASDAWTLHFERPSVAGRVLEQRREYADGIASAFGFNLDGNSGVSDAFSSGFWESEEADRPGASEDPMRRIGGYMDEENPWSAAMGDIMNPGGAGTYGQVLGGVGSVIGGMPGMAIGTLVGGLLDSRRQRQDVTGEGMLDSIGDGIDKLFGMSEAEEAATSRRSGSKGSGSKGMSSGDGGGSESDYTNAVMSAVSGITGSSAGFSHAGESSGRNGKSS